MTGKQEVREKKLSGEQFNVLRMKATEAPFTGKLLYNKKEGIYSCAACGQELFSSRSKFDSGTGWPSFDEPMRKGALITAEDESMGIKRIEVLCGRCGSHLGHVFDDGPTETGKRYCINSVALDFTEKKNQGK